MTRHETCAPGKNPRQERQSQHWSLYNHLYFMWITPLLMKGYRTGNVRAADLVDTPQYYDPECISSRFDKLYGSAGRKGGKAGLRLAVFRFFAPGAPTLALG